MTSIGERLRRERVRQGLDLAVLARATRIQPKYLQAIEGGRVEDLPGAFFYRSFVRQYAAVLQVDPQELETELDRVRVSGADALDAALREHALPPKAVAPIIVGSDRLPSGSGRMWGPVMLLGVVIVVCTVIYGWWSRQPDAPPSAVGAPVGDQIPSAAVARTGMAASAPDRPPRISQTAAPRPAIIPVAETQPSPEPRAAGMDDRVVVKLEAKDKVWVSASASGKRLYAGLLGPSDSKVLTSDTQFRMRIGNAGALAITWNGQSLGVLGSSGQVRDVVFTADNYRVLSPDDSL